MDSMRVLLCILLALLFVVGCAPAHAPSISIPATPTLTATPAAGYYAPVDADTAQALRASLPIPGDYYVEIAPPGQQVVRAFALVVISSGEIGIMQAGDWRLDVVWVFERNRAIARYPLVVGVQDRDAYLPYYLAYQGAPERVTYLGYLTRNGILDRGRKLFPSVEGEFVSRAGIDWASCGADTACNLGKFMQAYGMDKSLISGILGWRPIPDGWALAWKWDAATEANTLPGEEKIVLP